MNIYELLRNDHDTVSKLFQRIEESTSLGSRKAREELFSVLRAELLAHLQAEREVFQDVLLERIEDQDSLLEVVEENSVLERLIKEVDACAADDARWKANVAELKDSVGHHVEDEEGELFEVAREHLEMDEAEELGERMRARREEIVSHFA